MVFTVTKLVTRAFHLSGVVSRDIETVSGSEQSDGLDILNGELSFTATDATLIPYYAEVEVTAVVGQEKYFIPNLVEPSTFTFNVGTVRYQTRWSGRESYFGSSRTDDIRSLPFNWHTEAVKGGTDLFLYFLPSDDFKMKIVGKFAFSSLKLNTDLELIFDLYYIQYLKYALASLISDEWMVLFPASSQRQLDIYRKRIKSVTVPDLANSKITQFSGKGGLNWADVNIGRGYRPS